MRYVSNSTPIHSAISPNHTRAQALEDRICELAAHIDAATFRWLELVREYDECGGWAGDGILSCAHWLNWKCGLGLNAARERVRVAHALGELPKISEAFRKGRVSYSKVRAMTRVATTANEDVLLNIALNGTASHVERAVRAWRRVRRGPILRRENERHLDREVSWMLDEDGCLLLHARLTPEQGAVVRQALEAAMDQLFQENRSVSTETSEADAEAMSKPRPHAQSSRRADALTRVAEAWLSGSHSVEESGALDSTPSNVTKIAGGDRFVVNVHTDIETLKADGDGAEAEIEEVGNVSAETSRRLACDASVIRWLDDADGQPLSVGRKTRTVPPALRRALQRRDGGCRFPGCTCTRFVDAHHIHHWADGGETNIDNLVLMCRRHHRLVHEGGFGLRREAGGRLCFTNPAGERIPEAHAPRFRGNISVLRKENADHGVSISSQTSVPGWLGERMELDIVMAGLARRE